MNIFATDSSPLISAKNLVNVHCVKQILESAQLLCSQFPKGEAPYKRTHYNHPCSIWTRRNVNNYKWLLEHALAICQEYSERYGRVHKSLAVIRWCETNYWKLDLPEEPQTDFPQCFGEFYQQCFIANNSVQSYRNYYNLAKRHLFQWKKNKPDWIF